MAAGEHRYEDSYFLKRDIIDAVKVGNLEQPKAKKAKTMQDTKPPEDLQARLGSSVCSIENTDACNDTISSTKDVKDNIDGNKAKSIGCCTH